MKSCSRSARTRTRSLAFAFKTKLRSTRSTEAILRFGKYLLPKSMNLAPADLRNSPMKYILLVALREFAENAKTKGFWIGILLVPVMIYAGIKIPALLE